MQAQSAGPRLELKEDFLRGVGVRSSPLAPSWVNHSILGIEDELTEYYAWVKAMSPAERSAHDTSIGRLAWIIDTRAEHLPMRASWPFDRTCPCDICADFWEEAGRVAGERKEYG